MKQSYADVHIINKFSSNQYCDFSPDTLLDKWKIRCDTARQTLNIIIQQGIQHAAQPITRRYRTNKMSLKTRQLQATIYPDTCFINSKSLKQNTWYQHY